jgi:hypothetical protein
MSMRPLIGERDALLMRYLMVFLIGYVLFTIHAGADNRKKANAADSVPYIEPGKARLVDLASLPPQLRRTVDDESGVSARATVCSSRCTRERMRPMAAASLACASWMLHLAEAIE